MDCLAASVERNYVRYHEDDEKKNGKDEIDRQGAGVISQKERQREQKVKNFASSL